MSEGGIRIGPGCDAFAGMPEGAEPAARSWRSALPTGTLLHRPDRLWYRRLFADPDFLQLYIEPRCLKIFERDFSSFNSGFHGY